MMNWKKKLGQQLKDFRQQANRGKGLSHERVAVLSGMTKAYVIRLETNMKNTTLDKLDKLAALYGRDVGELFQVIVPRSEYIRPDLHEKLDFILRHGMERIATGVSENIEAMHARAIRLKKEQQKEM